MTKDTHNTNATPATADDRLDALLSSIRSEAPATEEACLSVRTRLAADPVWQERPAAAVLPMAAEASLRTCDDYREVLPAYLEGVLPEARALLVEDHLQQCIPCRKRLQALRSGAALESTDKRSAGSGWLRTAAIAATFLGAIFASWFAWRHLVPAGQSDLIQVKSIDGQLFALGDSGLEPLYPGDSVDGRREIRTGKGSGALLQLADGSRVEVNERAALEVVRRRDGLRIRVDRGDIIVEAAPQREGTLDVSTDEMMISVKGTIFAVSHGTKGSRVSVIEGEVQVEQARQRRSLYPGDQLGSRRSLVALPLAQEIAWSGDVDRYIAMLREFGELRDSLNQVLASAQPRYSSELLEQVPVNTAVYIALPNPAATLSEVYGLIRQKLAGASALGSWNDIEGSGEIERLDEFVSALQELSEFLGEETVVALGFDQLGSEKVVPMVLSQVENSLGLRSAVEARLEELRAEFPDLDVVLVDDNTINSPLGSDQLFVYIGRDLLIATSELSEIRRISNGISSGFEGTDFYAKVTEAYDRGAEYLGALDLASLVGSRLDDEDDDALRFTGLGTVEYLVVERQQDEERAYTAADLTFSGERQGMAAWLAAPAAMESLEFVSANASFASGAVYKDPASIFDEILALVDLEDRTEFDRIQAEVGIDFRQDLAAALGGEATIAIDGPLLPNPSWKAIVEVYDERRLQSTLQILVDRINAEQDDVTLAIHQSTSSSGRTMYELAHTVTSDQNSSPVEQFFGNALHFVYTYVDGFLVAGPSASIVEQAILIRESGASLVTSEVFRDLLPRDGYVDFSAVVFNRMAETLAGIADRLPLPEGVTSEQRGQIDELIDEIGSRGPTLYCLYGEADRIRFVSNGASLSSLGSVGSLIGLSGLSAAMPFLSSPHGLTSTPSPAAASI